MDKFTIGSCGFCSTGSSVVTDILKEYDDNVVLDDIEFTLTWRADGIEDLRYFMFEGCRRDLSSRIALERFRTLCFDSRGKRYQQVTKGEFQKRALEYLNDITQVKWIGPINPALVDRKTEIAQRIWKKWHLYKYLAMIEDKIGHQIEVLPLKKVGMSIRPENFISISKDFVMDVLGAMGSTHDKNTVLDQPFCGNNPVASFPYFDNPLAIVVDRDPRDHYLFSKMFLYKKGTRQIPTQNVRDYVTFYKNMREDMPYKIQNERILCVRFEDFIYKPIDTRKLLLEFTKTDPNSWKRKIFEPEKSIHNTQLFKRFPEYAEDTKYIERELGDYLYPFEDYGDIDTTGEMFMGKSRLNKK